MGRRILALHNVDMLARRDTNCALEGNTFTATYISWTPIIAPVSACLPHLLARVPPWLTCSHVRLHLYYEIYRELQCCLEDFNKHESPFLTGVPLQASNALRHQNPTFFDQNALKKAQEFFLAYRCDRRQQMGCVPQWDLRKTEARAS